MSRLIIKTDGLAAPPLELKGTITRIGRSHTCDFQINHPTISGEHCEVVLDGDEFLVRDKGSTNGTFINGQPVKEAKLAIGQILRLGEVEMLFDAPPVKVSVPHLETPKLPESVRLTDGSLSCLHHHQARGAWCCGKCHKYVCDTCVHDVHRIGGKSVKCCPVCGGVCEYVQPPVAEKPKKKSIFARLQSVIVKPFQRRR